MKKSILYFIISLCAIAVSCGKADFINHDKYGKLLTMMTFPSSGDEPSGDDALSATTNQSDKDDIKAPKLNAFEGAAFVKPPQINNYGTVTLSYQVDVPPGRAGLQPGVGLSYSSSGGDGLAGIGWSLSTGLGVISRTTKNGQLFYDWRDTFTFNGQRLVKAEGSAGSENGTYRLEIESGFSKFVLSNAESGGVWRVYDKAGAVTTFGDSLKSRIYQPNDNSKTYIWNFCKSVDLNGNYMTAEYDDSEYHDNHILYLQEIRYTGNDYMGLPARQFVRFSYKDRDEAYVSKAPGFIMKMDRLLDTITVGWDDPSGWSETELWSYRMAYETSADSNRPLLVTVDTERESTKPEFIYQPAVHSLAWAVVDNPHAGDPEENPDSTKYFEGDFNGDGISDMVFFNPKTGNWRAMEGNRGGGYFDRYYGNKFMGYEGPEKIQFFKGNVTGDYNGDGRSDIAFYLPETKEFWVAEHNGKTFDFKCYGKLYIDIDIFKCEWFTGDFDGNGLSDAVLYNEPTGEWYLMANKGGRFEFIKFSQHFKNLFRSDYAPDNNLDSPSTADASDSGKDRDKIFFLSGDYNGDGRTDISFYDARSGKWWVAENYRDDALGFKLQWKVYKEFTQSEKEMFAPANDSLMGNDRFSGDFNGDGFSDFLIFHRDRGEWIIGETGNGTINFRVYSRTPQYKDVTRWLQGDFNGDGRTDIGFYSKTDNNFWIGEATPSGFRYRIYNNLAYGPDPARVLATPLPRDEVQLTDMKAVIAGAASTAAVDYQYDGNFHTDRGEKAFAGYFTAAGTTPELLIYNKETNRLSLKQGAGAPEDKIGVDLDSDGISILNNEKPDKYRLGRDGLLYYKKTSSFGGDSHSFRVVYAQNTGVFTDEPAAQFDGGSITDFQIDKSAYLVDQFKASDGNKYVLILDDKAETPKFALFTGSGKTDLSITSGDGTITPDYFNGLRNRRSGYRFFSGKFTADTAQVLFVDMTGQAPRWFLGTLSAGSIGFTMLAGSPQFASGGFIEYRVVPGGSSADLVYATTDGGTLNFHKLSVSGGAVSQINYAPLGDGAAFKGEFTFDDLPVVRTDAGLKKAVLDSSCRLLDLGAAVQSMKRPDLLTKVYPFQWIQGDYNGDGKTDIGIFNMKENHWYFALTQGTVPDLISVVKNGIGGTYRMDYGNSTKFDNTDDEGIPRLPMNYKVCTGLTVEDGRGHSVLTQYEYEGGYAFSAFIDGEKETDYFGFSKFTVIDAVGRRSKSEYNTVPYDDYRMNRALAGAVKTSRTVGSDQAEYERTEHEYTIRVIAPSGAPLTPRGVPAVSYLIEPTQVKKFVAGTLTETRGSSIELAADRYEMISKAESVTDHYADGAHRPQTMTSYSKFTNIDATNEMRLELKKNLDGSAYETTTSYAYDEHGNVTRESARYTGSGLPAASDKIMEYAYDGYGNRIRSTNASGSPARVTEKTFDERLHQFVVEERALGDALTLKTGYDINYASAFGGINKKTDPNGNANYFEYDNKGRLSRERIDADSGTETLQEYSYNPAFPLSAKVTQYVGPSTPLGGRGDNTIEMRVFADGMGRVIHQVRSADGASGKRYVKSGRLTYDPAGRVIRKSQTDWAGDDEIDAFHAQNADKYPTDTRYDAAGRVFKVTLPEGYQGEPETSITYTYNDPWETIETHSVGRSKRTVKNARGQVLYIEDSGTGDDGRKADAKIGFAYDLAGNRVKKMDLNNTTMTEAVPTGLFSPGQKDTSGNNIACWQYNAFGQMVASSDPDLGYTGVSYNAFGEAESKTDALGRVTTLAYDRMGRLVGKNLPGDEGSVEYRYDTLDGSDNGLGRMVSMDDPVQRKEFSYDRIGRVKREERWIKPAGDKPDSHGRPARRDGRYETRFEYDLLSRKTKLYYPTDAKTKIQMTVSYGYSAMGAKKIVMSNGETTKDIVSDIAYNEFGQMTAVTRGNGTVTKYNYDIKGRMETLLSTASHNGQTWKVQDVKYEFKTDNSIAAVENTPDVSADGAALSTTRYEYQYDGLNRLVHAKGSYNKSPLNPVSSSSSNTLSAGALTPAPLPGGEGVVSKKFELGYDYAANGNLTGKSVYDPDTGSVDDRWSYAYSNHAATSISTTKAGARFAMRYDAVGNLLSQDDHGKNLGKDMAYDSYNRIRQVTDSGTGTIKGKYYYDDQGFRVRKVARRDVDGRERTIETLHPSMYYGVEIVRNPAGHVIESTGYGVNHVYLNGVRVAAVLPNGEARYYLTDQVDSVKVVVDDRGLILSRMEYLPFGETWFQEDKAGEEGRNAPKYNSQELDKESGYYFYNARHYDPEIARFVTADNIVDGEYSTQGWNRYSYVHNNPIVYKDPTGHQLAALIDKAPQILATVAAAASLAVAVNEDLNKQLVSSLQQVTKDVGNLIESASEKIKDLANGLISTPRDQNVPNTDIKTTPGIQEDAKSKVYENPGSKTDPKARVLARPDQVVQGKKENIYQASEHTKNARPSKRNDHEKGQTRKQKDRGGEKGDIRRNPPRTKPGGWKGPWPPK